MLAPMKKISSRTRFAAVAALLASLALASAACAPAHFRKGDALAKEGKWEEALTEYREVAKKNQSNSSLKRVSRAEKEVSEDFVKRGIEAAAAGSMAEAAEWWKQANEIRPKSERIRVVIAEHAPKLETCGADAVRSKKWEGAFRCYEALQIAYPDRFDLTEKIEQAHKKFAVELDQEAQALAKKGLTGAALVLEMRTRHHDPMHPSAFERETLYRKQVQAASLVNVRDVSMNDNGHWGLGAYLAPELSGRLGEYPPYGPTKNPQAKEAVFVVSVEDFAWWDDVNHGISRKEIAEPKVSGKGKVANPEHVAQKALVEAIGQQVREMELAAGKMPSIPEPTPTPDPNAVKSPWKDAPEESDAAPDPASGAGTTDTKSGRSGKKSDVSEKVNQAGRDEMTKLTAKAAKSGKKAVRKTGGAKSAGTKKGKDADAAAAASKASRRAPAARVPTDEQIEAKLKAYDAARKKLEELPETVTPAEAAAAWYLQWKEVTRTVEARVRFEVRESDFSEPVSQVVTLQVKGKDRSHAGNEERKVEADALEIDSVEALTQALARKLADPGIDTLRQARDRRAEWWIERGRDARANRNEDEALDMYVRALFARGTTDPEGSAGLPGDVATVVAVRLEHGSFRDLVAGP